MKLSVVILNYNVRYFLEQCIRSVQKALKDIPSEIIVVDNNSSDGSCEMVRSVFPEITLIANKENVGFSKANNQGVALAKGEYVCILNPDTAVGEDTFLQVLEFIQKKDNPGAVGVKLIDGTGNFLPESKRNVPTPRVSYYKMLGKNHPRYPYYASHLQEDEIGEVPVLVGAFMLIKKSVYQAVGGFDEDYFMYGEDIDLSYKLLKGGYKNYYFGKTTVLHYKGESTTKDKVYFERFYGAMSIFYRKHFKANNIFKWLINIGVWGAKTFKTVSQKPEKSTSITPPSVYVVSDDVSFVEKIKSTYNNVSVVTLTDMLNKNFQKSQFVFDAQKVSYRDIFKLIQKLNNQGNIFRIKPQNALFIIGSDSSTAKGDVTLI